jgi:hypothetical protein
MSSLTNPTIKTVFGEWEEVYSVQEVTQENFPGLGPTFYKVEGAEPYYQTFGGGPEGGYIKKDDEVYRVSRGWGQPWKVELLKNVVLEFEPAAEMAGLTARIRKLEVFSLLETRTIIDEHLLWGNAIEIYKCLRDGLSPKADASYKDLCLGIILHHFCQIDKYLDILPPDSCSMTKQNLINLNVQHSKETSESESEDSGSDSE